MSEPIWSTVTVKGLDQLHRHQAAYVLRQMRTLGDEIGWGNETDNLHPDEHDPAKPVQVCGDWSYGIIHNSSDLNALLKAAEKWHFPVLVTEESKAGVGPGACIVVAHGECGWMQVGMGYDDGAYLRLDDFDAALDRNHDDTGDAWDDLAERLRLAQEF